MTLRYFVDETKNKLTFVEYGNPNGYPILVQHGLIASIRDGGLFDALVAARARVICVARPGYGESSPKEMENIGEWGKIISALADELRLSQFDVLGMSSGAPYSYAIGWWMPDRVRNLYIFSGIPAMYDDDILAHWPFPVQKNASLEEMQKLAHGLFFSNLAAEDLARNDTRDSMANHAFGLAQDFRLRCMDWGFRLSEVKQKVCMRHARFDQGVPFITAEMTAAMLPDCSLMVEENDIHFSEETLSAFIDRFILPELNSGIKDSEDKKY
jgi:pimeloyl-ACP methyl ester carboxylesterase